MSNAICGMDPLGYESVVRFSTTAVLYQPEGRQCTISRRSHKSPSSGADISSNVLLPEFRGVLCCWGRKHRDDEEGKDEGGLHGLYSAWASKYWMDDRSSRIRTLCIRRTDCTRRLCIFPSDDRHGTAGLLQSTSCKWLCSYIVPPSKLA